MGPLLSQNRGSVIRVKVQVEVGVLGEDRVVAQRLAVVCVVATMGNCVGSMVSAPSGTQRLVYNAHDCMPSGVVYFPECEQKRRDR